MRAFVVYVRPLLEYNSSVWSPSLKRDVTLIEQVQTRFTKRLRGYRHLHLPWANIDILSPLLGHFFNSCLEHGSVPSSFKSGYITPLLKKADLDATDVKSYQLITNLWVVRFKGAWATRCTAANWLRTDCFHIYSWRTVPTTQQKQLFWRLSVISFWHLTLETWQCCLFWTCLQRLTM